jgi:uncharacterized repeat protein (TIGR03803 family)
VDGGYPYSGLVQTPNGILYGGTHVGGVSGFAGTIYKILPGGQFNPFFSFSSDGSQGGSPDGSLLLGFDGNLYGAATFDGASGNGTLFQISTNGTFSLLYTFTALNSNQANPDGAVPNGGLVQAPNGGIYGVASAGGANTNGTVFEIAPDGSFSVLHTFSATDNFGVNADGAMPQGPLCLGSDGALYGVTSYGGVDADGAIFRLTTNGVFTLLYSFSAVDYSTVTNFDGAGPIAGLVQGSDGNFYGVADAGGTNGVGSIFKLLNPRPTITGLPAREQTLDNSTISPFNNVAINTTQGTVVVTVTLDNPADGSLTSLGGFVNVGGGVYRFVGTPVAAATALRSWVFTPAPHIVIPGTGVTNTLTVVSDDGAFPVTNTVGIVTIAVNSPPSFSLGSNPIILATNSGSIASNAWITAISPGPGAESGLSVSFIVTSDNPGLFTDSGHQPSVDSAGNLTFTVADGIAGLANVQVVATNNATPDNGGSATATHSFVIKVMDTPIYPGDVVVANRSLYKASGALFVVHTNDGTQAILNTAVKDCYTVAFDTNGDLLVANYQTPANALDGGIFRISQFHPAAPASPTPVSVSALFATPFGVAVEPNGQLLVADLDYLGDPSAPGAVFRVDPSNTNSATNAIVLSSGTNFYWLAGIAVATNSGETIYVTDHGSSPAIAAKVIAIDPLTGLQTVVSSGGNLVHPDGLAVDPGTGSLIVADAESGGGALIRVDPGTGIQTVLVSANTGAPFQFPTHVTIDPGTGDYLVTDGNSNVSLYSQIGALYRVHQLSANVYTNSLVSTNGFFEQPRGVAIQH